MGAGKFTLMLLVALVQGGFGFDLVVNPSETQWVMPGDEVRLSCKTSSPIHSCSWETPYGTHYPMEKGISAEGGRLAGFDDGSEEFCGVTVTKIEAKDAGDWRCHISVVSDGEAHPGDAQVSLHIATRPDSVSVLNNQGKLLEAIKDANGGKVVTPVTCVVGKADPKPSFEWFLGGKRLDNAPTEDIRNEADGSWSQILRYEPEASHHNQTLKCRVAHVGFQKGDETEAETILVFDEEALNFLRKGIVQQEVSTYLEASIYPAVGVVIFIVVVSVAFVIFHHYKMSLCGCRTYLETRRNVTVRGGNPGTPSTGSSSANAHGDPERGGQATEATQATDGISQTSWFKRCLEGHRPKKTENESASSDEAVVPAEKMDVPEDVVVEVRLPTPEKDEKATIDDEKAKADETDKANDGLEVPEASEAVPSEVKGRFRMFKWLKKTPKTEEQQVSKEEEVKMEKAAKEEMGEKASPVTEEAKDESKEEVEEAKEEAPQQTKNTAV